MMFRDFIDYIRINGKLTGENLEYIIDGLGTLGDSIEETKEKLGKVPRSHVKTLSTELKFCLNAEESNYIAIIRKDNGGVFEAYCLDPSIVLKPLQESATIHLSGTLRPFDIYCRMTGFEELPAMAIENVFPETNLLIGYKKGIGTRFSELNSEMLQKIGNEIQNIINSTKRKTIVFFPSRNLMNEVIDIVGNKGILIDSGDLDQIDLMHLIDKFKKENRALFTVIGGRLSEGINLPGKLLEIVILAGIPYPKPDVKQRTIMAYYDHLYGRGWDYAVTFPTLVKMRQTIGRLIRNVDDKGVAVILDERAEIFKDYLKGLREFIDVQREIEDFFIGIMK